MRYTNYKFQVPEEKIVRLIVDTDAKNEADDQFAIVHALLSPKFDLRGFVAAHYGTREENSMDKSYDELVKIFDLMNIKNKNLIKKGCPRALADTKTPIISEGVKLIIEEAMQGTDKLNIIVLGAITDVASALLIEPHIEDKIRVVWIGGGRYPNGGIEFNQNNDINALNVVFSSKAEVWQVPKNVYEMIPLSLAELEYKVYNNGKIGEYLFNQLIEHSFTKRARENNFRTGESWVLGDSPAVGLLLYEERFDFDYIQAPFVTNEGMYVHTKLNRPIRVYNRIDSRLILDDFFAKIALFSQKGEIYENN